MRPSTNCNLQVTGEKKPKNTCSCRYQASVSSETDSSGKTTLITSQFCLLATIHEPQLHQNTCTCIKFKNFVGLTRQSTPLILPQRKCPSWITHWKGNEIIKVVALKFTGFLGVPGDLKCQGFPCHNISPMNSTHY